MAGNRVGKAAIGLLTQHWSFYPEFASHACAPVWRSHPFLQRVSLAELEKGRACDLESSSCFLPALLSAPQLPPLHRGVLSAELPLPGSPPSCSRWASPLCSVALSSPPASLLLFHLPAIIESYSFVVINSHLSSWGGGRGR